MPVTPRRNLPPEAEPWGRWVEEQLRADSIRLIRADEDATNSFKAINGALDQLNEQVAALNEITEELAEQQAALIEQQADLALQTANLAARITVSTSIATFNTGAIPTDATWRSYGPSIPITIDVPTGKLVVTVGCTEASINAGTGVGATSASATFSISGGIANLDDYSSRVYNGPTNGDLIGAPLMIQRAFAVPPGTYTVTGQMRGWSGTVTGTPSINFRTPYLTVQVTG